MRSNLDCVRLAHANDLAIEWKGAVLCFEREWSAKRISLLYSGKLSIAVFTTGLKALVPNWVPFLKS